MRASRDGGARVALSALSAFVALVACSGGGGGSDGGGPRLDPGALPAELRGLVPGVSGEREVMAAWPDATVVRDRAFGGAGVVARQGWPAIVVEHEASRAQIDLIERDGAVRIVRIKVPVARACAEVFAAFGAGVRPGSCGNRVADAGEHLACSATPDGKHTVGVTCRDAGMLDLLVGYPLGHHGD